MVRAWSMEAWACRFPIPYGVAIQPASDRGVLGACLCSRYAGNLTWSPQRGEGRHCKCDGVVGFQWTRNGDGAEGLSTAPSGLLTHCTAHMHECLLESSTAEQQARYWSHWPVQLHLDIDGVYHTYSGAPLWMFQRLPVTILNNCPVIGYSTVPIEGGEQDIKSRDFWGIKFRYY